MYVIVHLSPHTTVTFPKAYADVFEPHTLTISRVLDGQPVGQFFAEDWQSVNVYDDETGYCACSFINHRAGRKDS